MSGSVGLFADSSDFWLVRTKADGDTLWTRTYGEPDSNNICQSGQLTFDGGYIMAASGEGMWLIKTNADGDTLWIRRTGGPGTSEPVHVVQTADSGYAIFGNIFGTLAAPDTTAPRNWLLIKTDSLGSLKWSRTYGGDGDEQSLGMLLTDDGGFLLTGWLDLTDTVDVVALWLVRTDSIGDTLWTTTVGDSGLSLGIDLLELAEGEYAVTGVTSPTGEDSFSGWLVRFGDPTAQSTTPVVAGVPKAFALHANYPNPFNPSTTIGFDLPVAAVVTLTVYDILGREVVRLENRQMGAGYHQATWNGRANDGREVPTGIYFARITAAEYRQTIKMLLLK